MSCPQCGPVPRKSSQYDHEYHTSPSLQRLRSSNLPPTNEELADVQTTLQSIHRDRVSLEARLTALSRVVASMKEECDALKTLENDYQSLVSARRVLPPELWSDIFLYSRSNDADFNCRQPSGIIWRLSHVCQAWRDVALSLHSFWSRIIISFRNTEHTEQMVQLLQLVLSRSKFLDIMLYHNPNIPSSIFNTNPIDVRILDLVLSQSHRWRSARLVHEALASDDAYTHILGRLPQLSSLTIDTYDTPENIRLFEDCPLLTKVTLLYFVIPLPVAQIRELNIGTVACPVWYDDITRASLMLVRQCPLLEILRVYIGLHEDVEAFPVTTHIRQLGTNSAAFITNLVVPQLRDAILYKPSLPASKGQPVPHILVAFRELVRRSDCARTLTSLKLIGISSNDYGDAVCRSLLIPLLVETTRLAVLELHLSNHSSFADSCYVLQDRQYYLGELMRALQVTERSTSEILLPCLFSLKIDMTNAEAKFLREPLGPNDLWGDFPAMLKARWAGDEVRGLRRLHSLHVTLINIVGSVPWEDGERLSRLSLCPGEQALLEGLVESGIDLHLDIQSVHDLHGAYTLWPSHPRKHLVKIPIILTTSEDTVW